MASSSTIPPAALDPFDLGIHTPINLNRGARAALLQNSPVVVNGTIGAERASPVSTFEQRPISIVESANDLAREHAEEYNTKLMVFRAFCTKFEEAAQQFVTGPQRRFAQQFADDFLGFWKRELSCSGPVTPKPTYSSVVTAAPPTDHDRLTYRQQQQHRGRQTDPPHRQGQQTTIAPPRQDLRVFIRLEAGAPARAHSSYAIRTLIREKLGAVSDKIRQVFQVRSGWAVLAADSATRDFLVEKQAEWAAELKPIAVETNKEWFTYVVSDVPTRLSDFYGNEVDSDSVVSDEIEIQTGLKPIDVRTGRQFSDNPLTKALLVSFLKPTKRFWSLFGSSAARLVDKTDRPRQCEKCWGHHFARNCHRQPVCRRCGEAGHLVDDCIAREQCVNCLGPHQANFHIPTNPYGNTIDLAFTNLPLAEAIVEDHLATSSDHFTLSLTFPDVRSTPVQPGKIRVTTEDELKRFVEIVELGVIGIPLTDSTPEELDELASSLVSLLTSAAKASGRPARKGGRPAPWWTEECADAAAAFRAIRRSYLLGFNQDVQIAKRGFHRVVRRAKRRYWRNLIDGFSSSSDVFKAVRWLKSPRAFQPPPLQVDNVVYESQIDKANALRQATLERRTAQDDITNPWMPLTPLRHDDVEKHPESALRWLGIWLDSRLSFRVHVEKWAAKAKAVAYHLRGFTNTIHGPLPSAVRSAVRACVEPVLLHGSEAWYPGRSRPRWNQPTKDLPSKSVFRTRLRRTDELLASCTRPKLVQRYFHKEQIPPLQIASKEKSADAFIRWVESLDLLTLVVYSDGSLSSEEVASYGFTIYQNNVPIFDGSGRLGPAEVFDAEATGALEGLKAALNLRDAATQNIFICLDNLAAATCLRGTPSDSSQDKLDAMGD
ncbi:hypothetical protein AU210_012320 [Fusarium oxysporum f. sp. radicis-cucumerinum]|uniref:CCHC-type domain-containing protein n=1 Tax=Fusarium oxysporum f. sp. radicis-cucumerinum TaxID=327505 RepID=A0A2H3G713_FUSOX|nr:hypothetical protein AU210_012320 [Fusarium oxysporum f. sp. radicis-cucumerinum]